MKNTKVAFILVPAAAVWLVFAGCASAPPVTADAAASVAQAPAVVTESVPAVLDSVAVEPAMLEPAAVVTEPVVDHAPAAHTPGKQVMAEEERQEALKAMARADEVQGKTAEKAAYGAASSVFANGTRNMGKEDWDAAYFDFHSARESFDLLAARAGDKKRQALDALNRSKARASESETFALAADAIVPQDGEAE